MDINASINIKATGGDESAQEINKIKQAYESMQSSAEKASKASNVKGGIAGGEDVFDKAESNSAKVETGKAKEESIKKSDTNSQQSATASRAMSRQRGGGGQSKGGGLGGAIQGASGIVTSASMGSSTGVAGGASSGVGSMLGMFKNSPWWVKGVGVAAAGGAIAASKMWDIENARLNTISGSENAFGANAYESIGGYEGMRKTMLGRVGGDPYASGAGMSAYNLDTTKAMRSFYGISSSSNFMKGDVENNPMRALARANKLTDTAGLTGISAYLEEGGAFKGDTSKDINQMMNNMLRSTGDRGGAVLERGLSAQAQLLQSKLTRGFGSRGYELDEVENGRSNDLVVGGITKAFEGNTFAAADVANKLDSSISGSAQLQGGKDMFLFRALSEANPDKSPYEIQKLMEQGATTSNVKAEMAYTAKIAPDEESRNRLYAKNNGLTLTQTEQLFKNGVDNPPVNAPEGVGTGERDLLGARERANLDSSLSPLKLVSTMEALKTSLSDLTEEVFRYKTTVMKPIITLLEGISNFATGKSDLIPPLMGASDSQEAFYDRLYEKFFGAEGEPN